MKGRVIVLNNLNLHSFTSEATKKSQYMNGWVDIKTRKMQ